MSKVAIQGNASGTGTFTIQSPATNTDRVLTLPDEAGTVLTSASTLSSSNLSGALPAIDGSSLTGVGGKIVNIATASRTSSTFETSSSSYVDVTDLSINYTMQDSSNKLYVCVAGHVKRGSQGGGIKSTLSFDGSDQLTSATRSSDAKDDDSLPFGTLHIDGYSGAKTIKARVSSMPGTSKVQVTAPATLIVMEYTP